MKSSQPLVPLARQWSMLLSSGINLLETLDLLQRYCQDKQLKDCLHQVLLKVSGGHRLSQALSGYPRIFVPHFVAMVRLGEEMGGLNQVLVRLADWLERDEKIVLRWRGALMYPVFVLGVSALLVFLLFFFVLPAFVEVFAAFKMPLPWITRVLLWLAVQVHNPLAWLLVGFLSLEGYRQLRLRWRSQKRRWVNSIQSIPGLGPLYRAGTLSRLCLALECSVSVGVPLLRAWSLAAEVSQCPLLQEDAGRVLSCCKAGETLTEALEVSPLYPSHLREMVRAGEEVGLMAPLLARLGSLYDQELEHRLAIFTALIEPALLSGLALLVAVLVLSLMLPLYSLINQMAG